MRREDRKVIDLISFSLIFAFIGFGVWRSVHTGQDKTWSGVSLWNSFIYDVYTYQKHKHEITINGLEF